MSIIRLIGTGNGEQRKCRMRDNISWLGFLSMTLQLSLSFPVCRGSKELKLKGNLWDDALLSCVFSFNVDSKNSLSFDGPLEDMFGYTVQQFENSEGKW
ncbi:hypothetical protein JOQ06_024578 [Pogonophryne albipinna]|uniref:Uncharacterized protein n=2 Tax=Pogonophryne albipinna TaxID=1090488 RepID=A0AAD6A9K9_9TELE|nr:hypothetical protein JOQ06_024578 [Pogonophryne albipinna]